MRAHQFINEIQPLKDIQPGSIVTANRQNKNVGGKSFKLPGNNNYYYSISDNGDSTGIYILDDGDIIGKLELESVDFPLKRAVIVDYITVHKHYTGFGIAKSLYGIVLSIMRRPLVSGNMQTSGGRRNWLSLSKIPGVKVRGYIKINDSSFDGDNKYYRQIADRKIEAIMNSGAEYIGQDANENHYFAFDVEGGDNQMKAVVDTVELYSRDFDITYDIGMFAQWSGK
jgi:hypothetical protein